jgi:hypothetical protein
MKKNLALLLCLALCLSSLIGLTAYAEETETSLPAAPEIALVNVSIRSNVAMLFAVPVGDFTVNADGTVDGLNLLVWKGESEYGKYGRGSADATLKAQGKLSFGGETYVVFVYTGLTAKEMTDTVYARTVVSDGKGNVAYGEVIDYSITEWAKNYESENEANTALVENLIAYGAAMQAYRDDYKPSGYYADQAKELVAVTVNSKVAGETVQSQVTQLAVAGSTITLASPVLDGYKVSEWSVSDADAETEGVQVKVDADMTIDATFAENNDKIPAASIWTDSFESATTGQFKDNTEAAKGYNMISANLGIRVNTGNKAYAEGGRYAVSYDIVEDGENKYLSLTSTAGGAIYANKDAHDNITFANTDIAEAGALTVKFSLKRNETGRAIDMLGMRLRAAGATVSESMRIFNVDADGTVNLAIFRKGKDNVAITTKIGEIAESGWSSFAVVVDLENLVLYGYMMNASGQYELKAKCDVYVPSGYNNVYEWAAVAKKIQWEVANSQVSADDWNAIVPEAERAALAELTGDAYKAELFRITEKYFSIGIDNYEILSGNAID